MDPKFVISHNGPIMGKNYSLQAWFLKLEKTHPPNLHNFKTQRS